MLSMTTSKRRLATFVIIGWILLLVSDRVSTLRLYQGSYVATYTLAVASIILLIHLFAHALHSLHKDGLLGTFFLLLDFALAHFK